MATKPQPKLVRGGHRIEKAQYTPRITRLGDPANPYTKKKGGSASPAPAPAKVAPKTPPAPTKDTTVQDFFNSVKRGANTLMKNWNESSGGGARKRKLDREIRRQGG